MQTNKGNTTLIIVIAALVILALWWFSSGRYATVSRPLVSNFIQCAERGYQVLDSRYPRQCVAPDGRVYTESALTATAYTSRGQSTSVYQQYNTNPYTLPNQQFLAYIKYPIAQSTSMSNQSPSRYIVPVDAYDSSSRSSTYYLDTYPPTPAGGGAPNYSGCYVSGCSSQICSDQPGMMSTCEYRQEYSCYQGARCERQANGLCGWTPTPELNACLYRAY